MLFWTARVSLESLHCVECVVSLLKWKLRGGNWILPAVSALPAWRKNKHACWEQWTFLETLGYRFLSPFFFFLFFKKDKKRPCWGLQAQVAGPRAFSLSLSLGSCLAQGIRIGIHMLEFKNVSSYKIFFLHSLLPPPFDLLPTVLVIELRLPLMFLRCFSNLLGFTPQNAVYLVVTKKCIWTLERLGIAC